MISWARRDHFEPKLWNRTGTESLKTGTGKIITVLKSESELSYKVWFRNFKTVEPSVQPPFQTLVPVE